jgi:hypothetical protein
MRKNSHIYFTNRKEYYRRKKISASLRRYHKNKRILEAEPEEPVLKNYFVNFEISGTNGYVKGYIISMEFVSITEARLILKRQLPKGYDPINFQLAEEETNNPEDERLMVILRDDEEVIVRNV